MSNNIDADDIMNQAILVGALSSLAGMVKAYYDALLDHGAPEKEALLLANSYQSTMLTWILQQFTPKDAREEGS